MVLYAPYELFTSSWLPRFETRPGHISGTGLAPIGILVSSTTTPATARSHRGHVCVRGSQVNHPSNMPATRLKLTEQDRIGDTHSEELNGGGGTQRCCTQNLEPAKSSSSSPVQEDLHALCAVCRSRVAALCDSSAAPRCPVNKTEMTASCLLKRTCMCGDTAGRLTQKMASLRVPRGTGRWERSPIRVSSFHCSWWNAAHLMGCLFNPISPEAQHKRTGATPFIKKKNKKTRSHCSKSNDCLGLAERLLCCGGLWGGNAFLDDRS